MSSVTQDTKEKTVSKWSDLGIRLLSAAVLVLFQIAVICGGRYCLFAEIIVFQAIAFYEIIRIGSDPKQEESLSYNVRIFPYVLMIIATYYLSAPYFLKNIFCDSILSDYHNLICYLALVIAFAIQIIGLKPETLPYSYKKLGWSISGIVFVVVPANIMARVAQKSTFWFFLSIALIIWNDSAAYFCGRIFGRVPLIKLSPKKTLEGFVGALIFVPVLGFFAPLVFAKIPIFFCHNVKPFDFYVQCETPPEFVPFEISILSNKFSILPSQIHGFVMGMFASYLAPFGGFLASGLKRAASIKDFGNIIPGHGGILDRIDCQLVMAAFSYLYIKAFTK